MRLLAIAVAATIATSSWAQAPGTLSSATSSLAYTSDRDDPAKFLDREPTPSMDREKQERQQRGWAFIATHARTSNDVLRLAQSCSRTVSAPDYCAIPEMRQVAHVARRSRASVDDNNGEPES